MDDASKTQIMQAVDARFDDAVQFLSELTAPPSTWGNVQSAQTLMADTLKDRGYEVDRWLINADDIAHMPGFSPVIGCYDDAVNVVGTRRARGKGRSLILNGHIDVVPEGPLGMWDTLPYEPRVDGGWMSGRGAGDMKAGLVSNLFALGALRDLGLAPAGDIHYKSVVEEECTGNGALACLQRGYRADAALISEPFAGSGSNAIEAAIPLIAALHEMEDRWNLPACRYPEYHDHNHGLNLNIGKIQGGDWTSSVPAWCVFDVRMGLFLGQDISALETAHSTVSGNDLNKLAITAATDARFFGLYADTPALVYGPKAEAIHGFNERVDLESTRRVTQATALFIANWCGLEPL